MNQIFDGSRVMNVACFGSGSGTNIEQVIEASKDPAANYKVQLIVTDKISRCTVIAQSSGIEYIYRDGFQHCGSWKNAQGNPELEEEYNRKSTEYNALLLDEIRQFEARNDVNIDLIVLGGYMRIVKDPLLSAFRDRIINVHPADLTALNEDGSRKYVGDNAVYDAINAGKRYTLSSVIIVNSGTDAGEIITEGPVLKVWGEIFRTEELKEFILPKYAPVHQELQKAVSDWPALTQAVTLIAQGKVYIGEGREGYRPVEIR